MARLNTPLMMLATRSVSLITCRPKQKKVSSQQRAVLHDERTRLHLQLTIQALGGNPDLLSRAPPLCSATYCGAKHDAGFGGPVNIQSDPRFGVRFGVRGRVPTSHAVSSVKLISNPMSGWFMQVQCPHKIYIFFKFVLFVWYWWKHRPLLKKKLTIDNYEFYPFLNLINHWSTQSQILILYSYINYIN